MSKARSFEAEISNQAEGTSSDVSVADPSETGHLSCESSSRPSRLMDFEDYSSDESEDELLDMSLMMIVIMSMVYVWQMRRQQMLRMFVLVDAVFMGRFIAAAHHETSLTVTGWVLL